jgi:hypothetical protein
MEGAKEMATVACKDCMFVDQNALKTWNKGKQTPYCTFPGLRTLSREGDCLSGRKLKGSK